MFRSTSRAGCGRGSSLTLGEMLMTSEEYERFVEWCHSAPLSELVRVTDDKYLCSAVHAGLWRDAPDVWDEIVGEVKLIGCAIGAIGNGGFSAISADGIPADRDFSRTVAALNAIGAKAAAEIFTAAVTGIAGKDTPLDGYSASWFEEEATIYRLLARHIRSNSERLLRLADV